MMQGQLNTYTKYTQTHYKARQDRWKKDTIILEQKVKIRSIGAIEN